MSSRPASCSLWSWEWHWTSAPPGWGHSRGPSVLFRREMCALCPWWSLCRWDTSSERGHILCTRPDGHREWTRGTPLGPYTLYTFSLPGVSATVLPSVELWRGRYYLVLNIAWLQTLIPPPPVSKCWSHSIWCHVREEKRIFCLFVHCWDWTQYFAEVK